MQDDPVKPLSSVRSRPWMLLLLGVFMLVGGCFILSVSLEGKYIDIEMLAFSLVPFILALICFPAPFLVKFLFFYDDYIEVKSFWGSVKSVSYSDIHSWSEFASQKGVNIKQLFLYSDSETYVVNANAYQDYENLKIWLTKGKTQVEYKEEPLTKKPTFIRFYLAGVISILFFTPFLSGVIFFTCAYIDYFSKGKKISATEVGIVGSRVINQPDIVYHKPSKGSAYYDARIILDGYPDYKFMLAGSAYSASDHYGLINNVHPGDSLYIGVSINDYLKKITHKLPLGFLDKTYRYKYIDIYTLRDSKGNNYLTLNNYNNADKSDSTFSFCMGGLLFTGLSLFILRALIVYRKGLMKKKIAETPL